MCIRDRMCRALPRRMNPNEPTRFFKGYSVRTFQRFWDFTRKTRSFSWDVLMETSNTSISGVRTDLLTPESDTSTCTMIVMERRPNALEKYERPESKSDGYWSQKSFYRQQLDDRKTKKLMKTCKAMHSNNTTVQNAKNRLSPPKRLRSRRKGPKPEKEGFFAPPCFV